MLSRASYGTWEQNPAALACVNVPPDALYQAKARKVPYYRKWRMPKKYPNDSLTSRSDCKNSQLESNFLNSSTLVPSEGQTTTSRFAAGPCVGTEHSDSTVTPWESISSVNRKNQAVKSAQKASKRWKLQLLKWTLTFERQRRTRRNGNDTDDTKANVSQWLKQHSSDDKYDSGNCCHALERIIPRNPPTELPGWSSYGHRQDQNVCAELDARSSFAKPVLDSPNHQRRSVVRKPVLNSPDLSSISAELPQNRFSAFKGSVVEPSQHKPISASASDDRSGLSSAEEYKGSSINDALADKLNRTDELATVDQIHHSNSTDAQPRLTNKDLEHTTCRSEPSAKQALRCHETYGQGEGIPLLDGHSTMPSSSTNRQQSAGPPTDPDTSSSSAHLILPKNLSLTKLSVVVPVSSSMDQGPLTSSSIASSSSPADVSPISHMVSTAPTSTSVSPVLSSPSTIQFTHDEDEDIMQQIEDAISKDLLPKILETFSRISKAQHEARIQELFRRGISNLHTHAAGPHTASNGTGGDTQTGGLTSNESTSNTDKRESKGKNKRALRDDEEDAEKSDDDEDRKRPAPILSPTAIRKKFACPFHKLNPAKFGSTAKDTRFRTCGRGFACPKHLKLHLKRIHSPPPHCDRCSMVFSSQEEKIQHAKQISECAPYDDPEFRQIYIMQPEQREQILKKRKSTKITDEQYWCSIWYQLFPEAKLPSSIHPDYTDFKMILQMAMDECIPQFVKDHVDPDFEGDRLRKIILLTNDRAMDLLDDDNPLESFPAASSHTGIAVCPEDETTHSVSIEDFTADTHQPTHQAGPDLTATPQSSNLDEAAPQLTVPIDHGLGFDFSEFIRDSDDSDGTITFSPDLPSLPPEDPNLLGWWNVEDTHIGYDDHDTEAADQIQLSLVAFSQG